MSKITSVFTKITFYIIIFTYSLLSKNICKWLIWGLDDAAYHDSTNQMLRDTQIIGCADMPQRADMPLLPLQLSSIVRILLLLWPVPNKLQSRGISPCIVTHLQALLSATLVFFTQEIVASHRCRGSRGISAYWGMSAHPIMSALRNIWLVESC